MSRSPIRFWLFVVAFAALVVPPPSYGEDDSTASDPVLKENIPANVLRSFLPADEEIIRHTISEDKWPKNKGEFERNETVELAIGRAIRAKKGDRDGEERIRPSVVFDRDRMTIRGGWRAHVDVPNHGDYFDGVFKVCADVGFVAGEPQISIVEMRVKWNASSLSKLVSVLTLGQVSLHSMVEQKLRERIVEAHFEKQLREMISEVLTRLAAKHAKAVHEIASRSEMSLSKRGLEIQVHLAPTFSVMLAPVGPAMSEYFQPKRVKGDLEFGGNGPDVFVELEFRLDGSHLQRRVRMKARETGEDPSLADGASKWEVVYRDDNLVGARILGRRKFVLADQVLEGHGIHSFGSAFGNVQVRGDTDGDDIGRFTGVRVRFDKGARLPLLISD